MPADTYFVAPDALSRLEPEKPLPMDSIEDKFLTAQGRIEQLKAALRQQMQFLDRIESADTGWWDKDEMADQKAAIWNALEGVQ